MFQTWSGFRDIKMGYPGLQQLTKIRVSISLSLRFQKKGAATATMFRRTGVQLALDPRGPGITHFFYRETTLTP